MNPFSKPGATQLSRREWLGRLVRTACLSVMAAFGVGQFIKARRLANDPDCIRLYTCQDCIEFGGCDLEKAKLFRTSQEKLESKTKQFPG